MYVRVTAQAMLLADDIDLCIALKPFEPHIHIDLQHNSEVTTFWGSDR
jgi:hypothetical protein